MYYNSFMQDVKIFNDHKLVAVFSGMTIVFKALYVINFCLRQTRNSNLKLH